MRAEYLLADSSPKLAGLVAKNSQFFGLDNGKRWSVVECSDFNILGRIFNGENVEPVLRQRKNIGFNMVRGFTRYDIPLIGKLRLEDHPDLYDRLPDAIQLINNHGLYVELVAYTEVDDPNHWVRLGEALQPVRNVVLLEFANEWSINKDHYHHVHPDNYQPIQGIICSHGSNGSGSIPVRPWWNYETAHWNAEFEWWRKVGHNAMEYSEVDCDDWYASHVPVLSNEDPRYPDNEQSLIHAYDAARGAALLCAGSCFHSVHGKNSTLWEGLELNAAIEWSRGAHSIDLGCQSGPYVHRQDLEGPNDLRVYERPVENHFCIAKIRK